MILYLYYINIIMNYDNYYIFWLLCDFARHLHFDVGCTLSTTYSFWRHAALTQTIHNTEIHNWTTPTTNAHIHNTFSHGTTKSLLTIHARNSNRRLSSLYLTQARMRTHADKSRVVRHTYTHICALGFTLNS